MTFWENFYYTFIQGNVATDWSIGEEYAILFHIFYVIPLGLTMVGAAYWASHRSSEQKERLIRIASILLLGVFCLRSIWFFFFDPENAPYRVVGVEISEIAAYLLIAAGLFIKNDKLYQIAFPLGMISYLAAFLVPYTVLWGPSLMCFRAQTTFMYHWLNGFISIMLCTSRGFRPQKSDFWCLATAMAVIFIIATTVSLAENQNWIWTLGIPVKGFDEIPFPLNISFLYAGYTFFSTIFLELCIFFFQKAEGKYYVRKVRAEELEYSRIAYKSLFFSQKDEKITGGGVRF